MNKIHWRRARLAAACCSALTASAILDSITGNWP
jgi:hypothetical protein